MRYICSHYYSVKSLVSVVHHFLKCNFWDPKIFMWNQDSIAKSIWQVLHRTRVVSFIKEELCTFDTLIYIMNSQKKNMVYRLPDVFDLGCFFLNSISKDQCILEYALEMWLDNILICQLISLFWIHFISMMFLWRGVPSTPLIISIIKVFDHGRMTSISDF